MDPRVVPRRPRGSADPVPPAQRAAGAARRKALRPQGLHVREVLSAREMLYRTDRDVHRLAPARRPAWRVSRWPPLREACALEEGPRYMIRDRDQVYGERFSSQAKTLDIREEVISPRSTWQYAYAERETGITRRQRAPCLRAKRGRP